MNNLQEQTSNGEPVKNRTPKCPTKRMDWAFEATNFSILNHKTRGLKDESGEYVTFDISGKKCVLMVFDIVAAAEKAGIKNVFNTDSSLRADLKFTKTSSALTCLV